MIPTAIFNPRIRAGSLSFMSRKGFANHWSSAATVFRDEGVGSGLGLCRLFRARKREFEALLSLHLRM